MPVLSKFFGIVIRMLFAYPLAPNFHASFGDTELVVSIRPVRIIQGDAPSAVRLMVLTWAMEHQQELLEAWKRCQNHKPAVRIDPLWTPASVR